MVTYPNYHKTKKVGPATININDKKGKSPTTELINSKKPLTDNGMSWIKTSKKIGPKPVTPIK